MDLCNDEYDANERMYFSGDINQNKNNCLVVKHIDIKWANLTDSWNIHCLVICINEMSSLDAFEKFLRTDHLDENNINRFPLECIVFSKQVSFEL